jgi:SAM-dependent methyltransferase
MPEASAIEKALMVCPVCGGQFILYLEPWLLHCRNCSFWKSLLGGSGSGLSEKSLVVEEHRQSGLKAVRVMNNETILNLLERFTILAGKSLLDVGCAYGWFLQTAKSRGMVTLGVEPEEAVAEAARLSGYNVLNGYFPDCVNPVERFDVIAFNDVLEHLPDPVQALEACVLLLARNGKLVVSIPVSTGLFYRVSVLFAKLCYRKPLYRLWQKDYRSPHVVYFNAQNLSVLADRLGFNLICRHPLKTMTLRGLWSRLKMDGEKPTPVLVAFYVLLFFLSPLLNVLAPPDLELFIFELRTQGELDGIARDQQARC